MPLENVIPFSAIAGNETAKKAVLCLLTNPHLKSVLVTGDSGTGKTALIRSISSLDPKMPVINVPIGITEDRLFGSVDLEKAISEGNVVSEKGLFGDADGGVIGIDDIDLMDLNTALEALETASAGEVTIEREGISAAYRTDVSLIASSGIGQKKLNAHLKDRFDICVRMQRPEEKEYVDSVRTNLLLGDGDFSMLAHYKNSDKELMENIRQARNLLPQVKVLRKHADSIARICKTYGISSYRGPIACAQTAAALAALDGRKRTNDEDIVSAAELCLGHRRTKFEVEKKKKIEKPENLGYPNKDILRFVHDDRKQNVNTSIVEKINEKTDLENVVELDETKDPEDEPVDVEVKIGKKFKAIDIMETEDSKGESADTKYQKYVETPSGRYSGFRMPKGDCTDLALDATIRAAAPYQAIRERPDGKIRIERQDLREKVRTRHTEQTFMFLLDTSGSLIIRNRMSRVKAAIISMLETHYIKRDRVGMITFNEENTELLLSPTRAVDELSQTIDGIKVGRGTPLSAAFMMCWNFVLGHKKKHPEQVIHIVLFTDGKSTKALDENKDPCQEALEIASNLKMPNLDWTVIDTGLGASKSDMPERLAEELGGRFFLLDDLEAEDKNKDIWHVGQAYDSQKAQQNNMLYQEIERARKNR